MLEAFSLVDRVAIVTGASSGLGRQMARALHDAGADVCFVARRKERLIDATADRPRAHAMVCDVTAADEVEDLVREVIAAHGRIDVLVNCAGTSHIGPAEDEEIADFRDVLETNLVAAYGLCQVAGRHMLEQRTGSIINVASVMGLVGSGRIPQAGYAASKAGMIHLSRELALQWARHGVRVNALAPGWFETELTAELFGHESGVNWVNRGTPLGRPGRIDELDGAAIFLASEASSFMTGQVLVVDGGWTAQ